MALQISEVQTLGFGDWQIVKLFYEPLPCPLIGTHFIDHFDKSCSYCDDVRPRHLVNAQEKLCITTTIEFRKVLPKHPMQNGGSPVSGTHISREIFRFASDFCHNAIVAFLRTMHETPFFLNFFSSRKRNLIFWGWNQWFCWELGALPKLPENNKTRKEKIMHYKQTQKFSCSYTSLTLWQDR